MNMGGLKVVIEKTLNNIPRMSRKDTEYYIAKEEVLSELVEHLKQNEDIVHIFDDKMMNSGGGYSSIQLRTLAKWLILASINHGIEKTLSQLENFLSIDYTPAIAVLAVSGIEPTERMQITDTIELIPFQELPDSMPKHALYPVYLQDDGLRIMNPVIGSYNPPKAALVKKLQLQPKAYDKNGEKPSTNAIKFSDLYDVVKFLTLHTDATPVATGSWSELTEDVPCANMLGGGFGYPSPEVLVNKDMPIRQEDWDDLQPYYEKYLKLNDKEKDLLSIVLQRINQARRRHRLEDRAIDQGIAYEVLFLNDKAHMEQLSFMLRLRASLLLENDITKRKEILDLFKAFYTCRSKATHEGKLEKKIKVPNHGKMEVEKLLERTDGLCIEAIKKIINLGGFPDWDSLMLGAEIEEI